MFRVHCRADAMLSRSKKAELPQKENRLVVSKLRALRDAETVCGVVLSICLLPFRRGRRLELKFPSSMT